MRLSPVQERFLVDWSLQEEAAGRAPSKAQLSRMALLILAEGDDQRPVGYRWVNCFLRCYNRVKTKPLAPLDTARTSGSTKAAYEDFY